MSPHRLGSIFLWRKEVSNNGIRQESKGAVLSSSLTHYIAFPSVSPLSFPRRWVALQLGRVQCSAVKAPVCPMQYAGLHFIFIVMLCVSATNSLLWAFTFKFRFKPLSFSSLCQQEDYGHLHLCGSEKEEEANPVESFMIQFILGCTNSTWIIRRNGVRR